MKKLKVIEERSCPKCGSIENQMNHGFNHSGTQRRTAFCACGFSSTTRSDTPKQRILCRRVVIYDIIAAQAEMFHFEAERLFYNCDFADEAKASNRRISVCDIICPQVSAGRAVPRKKLSGETALNLAAKLVTVVQTKIFTLSRKYITDRS